MGKYARSKGRRGETEAKMLLLDHDFSVADLSAGLATEDLIAIDIDGISWSVEVKNTKAISTAQRDQAKRQALARKLPWMLMSHIAGTSDWLIQRQGHEPVIWHKKRKVEK